MKPSAEKERVIQRLEDINLNQFKSIKEKINHFKNEWYITACVHLTGDLTHAGHVEYALAIKKKVADILWIDEDKVKLFVWLEDEKRTPLRKWKAPIYSNEERLIIWRNLKPVEDAYIWNLPYVKEEHELQKQNKLHWKRLTKHPSDLVIYLHPDVFVAHREHIDDEDKENRVREKLQTVWIETVIIEFDDVKKYLGRDLRQELWISSTNIMRKFVERQRKKIIEILKGE